VSPPLPPDPNAFPVRVMVAPVWNTVELRVGPASTVREMKRAALRAVKVDPDGAEFAVKFRGALVLDEGTTMTALGAGANVPFIILHARRQPVR